MAVEELFPLFAVQFRGPGSTGFVILRARNEDDAREIATSVKVPIPFGSVVESVKELSDSGHPGPMFSFFESRGRIE
jgi:hypothetical protein